MRLKAIHFYAPDGNGGAEPPAGDPKGGASGQNQQENGQNATPPSFDYEKLAGIIQGKQNVAEDTVLKNYFKQQGLSQADAEAAIAAFKQQKADSQPNVEAMQAQLNAAQAESRRLLGREPDKVGLDTWVKALAAGRTRSQVFQGFIQSEEYKNKR